MLRKLRADWRRGRARKWIRLGEEFNLAWTPRNADPIHIRARYDEEGEMLVLRVLEVYALEPDPEGPRRVDVGVAPFLDLLAWVAGMARDLGYRRMRVRGPRARERRPRQIFEFEIEPFLQRRGRSR